MTENSKRLSILTGAFIACLIAGVVLAIFDPSNILIENIKGAMVVLIAAIVDSARVAKKEYTSLRPPKGDNK